MNDNERDILLNRLLAGRDEPSVVEREALWQRIAATTLVGRRRRAWWSGAGISLVAALAAGFWLFAPDPELGVRGGDRASLTLSCVQGDEVLPCRPGATLVLEIGAPESRPYVSVFLERPDGVVVWIAPEPNARSATLGDSKRLGVRLTEAHPAGRSRAVLSFTPKPVTRDEIRDGFDAGPPESWTVLERPFDVESGGDE